MIDIGTTVSFIRDGETISGRVVGIEKKEQNPRKGRPGWTYSVAMSDFAYCDVHESEIVSATFQEVDFLVG